MSDHSLVLCALGVTTEPWPDSVLYYRSCHILPACHHLVVSFSICGLCIAMVCSCLLPSCGCFPPIYPNKISGLQSTADPGKPHLVTCTSFAAQVPMEARRCLLGGQQCPLPSGSDTCREYLFITKHISWSNRNSQASPLPALTPLLQQ